MCALLANFFKKRAHHTTAAWAGRWERQVHVA
jgi:hypothetical protein